MENLKDTKTAELLAELGKLETKIADRKRFMMVNKSDKEDIDYLETHLAQRNAIAAELDRRCSEAGLSIFDGFPKFTCRLQSEAIGRLKSITVDIAPKDLRDLLTWLIQKGGNG